jgi:molecular chaperone GrpE
LTKKKAKNSEKRSAEKKEMEPADQESILSEEEKDSRGDIEIIEEETEHPDQEENLIALTKENEALREKVLRKMADLENFKKRAEKERSEASFRAKRTWAEELLPLIDNFERAISSPEIDGENSFRQGIDLIHRQFLDLLKNMGVEEIEALGEKFNPQLHEAIEIHQTDQFEKDIILEVKRKGYLLDGRLLRPSYVNVAMPSKESKKE